MQSYLVVFCVLFAAVSLADPIPTTTPIAEYRESLSVASATLLPATRIAGGHLAAANQFPHQCSVLSPLAAGRFAVCGGSIISASWVLSAAHCTRPHRQFNLRFGSLNLWSGGQTQTSFRAINHPQHDPITHNNDISLVQIPSPLAIGGGAIRPVRLAAIRHQLESFAGWQATVSGWGNTAPGSGVQTLLRWVQMRVIPNAQCASVYGSRVVVGHVVCGLGWTMPGSQGHCGGDSGGPLTVLEAGQLTQIGVASFAARAGCDLGRPSGYMRVSHFGQWIRAMSGVEVRA